jgi:hypothetical protein
MKRLSLVLLALLCTGALLPVGAAEIPAVAPAVTALPASSPACAAFSSAAAVPGPSLPDFMVPEKSASSCSVNVLCRCGQVLSCTSASGDCQKVLGCSVTCDGTEQDCPPCHGFACF